MNSTHSVRGALVAAVAVAALTATAGQATADITLDPVADSGSGSSGSANVCRADPIDGHTFTCLPAPIDFLLQLLGSTGSQNSGSGKQLSNGSATSVTHP